MKSTRDALTYLESLDRPVLEICPVNSIPEIPIEHGIPIPERSHHLIGDLRAKLLAMEVGDSFVWAGSRTLPHQAAKRAGVRICVRKLLTGGWRLWRVA